MKFALLQTHLYWEDKSANLTNFSSIIRSTSQETDIIVLPEMFSTGFSMNTVLAEPMEGESLKWLREISMHSNALICGSLMIVEEEKVYNRFIAIYQGEILHTYDKRHLFRMAGEDEHFASGNLRNSFDYKGWRIRPNICYDLRFPVWSRNDDNFDVYLNVANWPDRRILHWKALLAARAIENQCFAIGVNRIGTDGKGILYSGGTAVFDFNGSPLADSQEDTVLYVDLKKQDLEKIRTEFPVWKDRDTFQV
jgi:predicted amidohydrolase